MRLREAEANGLVTALDRAPGDGSIACWVGLRATVAGLRAIGDWPPIGMEHLPGRWDEGRWGQRVLPRLRELADAGPALNFEHQPHSEQPGDDADWSWRSTLDLMEAGLITGDLQSGGVSDLIVTSEGMRAAAGVADDPLDRAVAELHRGAKADAMTAAVEEGLGRVVRGLAESHGVATTEGAKSKPVLLSELNNHLRRVAYDESWGAEIAGWLAIRNETNHGRGEPVSPERILRVIAGVHEFRELFDQPEP